MAGASPFVGTGGGWVVDAGASCLSWGEGFSTFLLAT